MVSNANAHLDACDDPRCGDPFHAIAERTAAKEEGDRTCAPMINMVHNLILDRDMEKEQWVIHILLHSFPDFRLLFYQTTVPDIYDRYFPDENQPLPSYLARFSAVLPNTTTHQAMISADQFRRSEFSFLQNAISAVNQGQHS